MTNTNLIMNHCPACESLCTVSKQTVDDAIASGAIVMISCHNCGDQFAPEGVSNESALKTGRAAAMAISVCPHCALPISVPSPLPNISLVKLTCPQCKNEIDPERLAAANDDNGKTEDDTRFPMPQITRDPVQPPKGRNGVNRVPLYILILAVISGYLYWARETGQLPIDHWIRLLGIIS